MHFFRHFCTITKHRHKVIAACFKAGIGWQGLRHDLSKYSPVEFLPGARNYQGFRSPNEVEREKLGYSPAWLHHKGRNRHHFEYWNDYNPKEKRVMPVKMPRKYVAEMFCDRLSASKTYQGKNYTDRTKSNFSFPCWRKREKRRPSPISASGSRKANSGACAVLEAPAARAGVKTLCGIAKRSRRCWQEQEPTETYEK